MLHELADERQLEYIEKWYPDRGYTEEFVGWNKRRYCTADYLRKLLRSIFEGRTHSMPYVAIHVIDENMIYEGLQIDGWVTDETTDPPTEKVGCVMCGGARYSFVVNNIRSVFV